MKVLVTGASGPIGSAVIARLSAEGYEVAALVRWFSGLCGCDRILLANDFPAAHRLVSPP